jgi:DNA-binding NarL/FixJ family response regulator
MKKIRIALIDDDILLLNLMHDFFQGKADFEVLFSCSNGKEAFEKLKEANENHPDVLLVDLKMDGLSGIEVTEKIRTDYPSIKVLVLSSHYKSSHIGFIFKTGASAFLPKGISPMKLMEIVKKVAEQGYFFDEDQMGSMRNQISSKVQPPNLSDNDLLSERELEIIRLICEQKTAKEIADKLFINQRTVEGHKNNLFVKTGAKNIAGLVIYAIQNKLIDESSLPII